MSEECTRDCHGSIDTCGHCWYLRERLGELKAENARLRAALQEFVDIPVLTGSPGPLYDAGVSAVANWCQYKARAALAQTASASGERVETGGRND